MLSSVILCHFKYEKCSFYIILLWSTTNEGTFKEIMSKPDDTVVSGYFDK